MKVKLDRRPRCKVVSPTGKPCDCHKGHEGPHEWTDMTGRDYEEWNDEPRT